jgi:uncharacterized protein (TIGR02001 family)
LASRALGLVLLVLTAAARADWSGSIALVSDYRFRGISLTDGQPALQANAAYDHPTGVFAGLFASNVDLETGGGGLGGQLYGGYAWRWRTGVSSDVGLVRYFFAGSSAITSNDYTELFAGVSAESFSARLSLTSSYFGSGASAGYLDLNAAREIGRDWSLTAHAGALATGNATTYASEYSDTRQVDFRLGVMRRIFDFTVGVNAVAVAAERGVCTNGNSRCNPTLLLVLQRSF